MEQDLNNFTKEVDCEFEGRKYSVRDNGAVYRHPKEGKKPSPLDCEWTFGKENRITHMMKLGPHNIHRIVAEAFQLPNKGFYCIVDHIDGNKKNNSPCNLRWITRAMKALENPQIKQKVIEACGSVEEYLNNPALLYGHEYMDKNFYWMRKLSKEEAKGIEPSEVIRPEDTVIGRLNKQEEEYQKKQDESVREELIKIYPRAKEIMSRPAPKYVGMDIFNKDNDPIVASKMREASKRLEWKIRSSTDGYISITAVDVCFFTKECWKCHLPYDAYFVVRLGLGPNRLMTGFVDNINPLDPTIVNAVKKYLQDHPELHYLMGEIKSRHSSIVEDNYMSFGCPHCDAIYGEFYLQNDILDEVYCFREEDVHHIVFDEEVKIRVV